MLSLVDMAVTRTEADDYATARGLVDWVGSDLSKDQALRRSQDYIAGTYNGRWSTEWENDAAPTGVKYAIFEGALREIKVPFSLTPDITLGREKILTAAGPLEWTPLRENLVSSDLRPIITSIEAMLTGLIVGGGSSLVVRA